MNNDESQTQGWFAKLKDTAKVGLAQVFPGIAAIDVARDLIAEAVAQRIRDAAAAKAQSLIAEAHRDVIVSIAWQNGVLALSLIPVYLLHAPWPFYMAYASVLAYNGYSVYQHREILFQLLRTRCITKTLSMEVRAAIDAELEKREIYERKVVEWLGPDLDKLSDEVARKLKPDVVAAGINMAFTLLMAFIAFRVFAIPLLEARALGN